MAWVHGKEDEVWILGRLPEFANSHFSRTARRLEVKDLETAAPRLKVDGLFSFTGAHRPPFGTNLFFSANSVRTGAPELELLGQSVHVVNFALDVAPAPPRQSLRFGGQALRPTLGMKLRRRITSKRAS